MRDDIFVERISVVLAALWLHGNCYDSLADVVRRQDLIYDYELGGLPASFALGNLKRTHARLFPPEADNKVNR